MPAGETQEVHFSVQVAAETPDWLDRVTNVAQVSYSGGSFEVRAVTLLPGTSLVVAEEATPSPPTPTQPPPADPPAPPPTETPLPTRPPVVDGPAPTPVPGATPLPAPALSKSVSPATVKAGEETTATWTLVFSNPTPLLVGGVVVRDPLPDVAFVNSETSQGNVEITGNLSRTIVVANLGDVPPGEQARINIVTLVMSDTVAGTVYTNTATYSALNVDPGRSNEARLVVEGPAILPVTGGLLDPRTPAGKVTWGSLLLLSALPVLVWRRARKKDLF
jgi:hypothetical protein